MRHTSLWPLATTVVLVSTPPDGPEPNNAPDASPVRTRLASLDRIVIPVLTALLALIATYLGAAVANSGAAANQREQITENRAITDRERRTETYITLLNSATEYAYAVSETFECIARENQSNELLEPLSSNCNATVNSVITARSDFQEARNFVYIYGSREADDSAAQLAGTLPAAVGQFDESAFRPVDFDMFTSQYRAFQLIACREVQTDPGRSCG